ncbi:hypothetical protein glysoja_048456 [Glycine soja]|uniref:SWIM-type domain-containing protein n=1 Tax=Glycine soja TaxID=3848 RepID=A0A0B2PIW5_GLYSO|nr:hypothetical protein glysoja_048456 [Glycine soja]
MDRLNMQIIIVALVTSGNKETYIWLLEQFNDAMKGNKWIKELYEKKTWSPVYIRGNSFVVLTLLGIFSVNDFRFDYGDETKQTCYKAIEMSAFRSFTKELFYIFLPMFKRASLFRVADCHKTTMHSIFIVVKYHCSGKRWLMSYCPIVDEFRCCCLRMESMGKPCSHILIVLQALFFNELQSLKFSSWSKEEREGIHAACQYSYCDEEDCDLMFQLLTKKLSRLKLKHGVERSPNPVSNELENVEVDVEDPLILRTKGSGRTSTTVRGRVMRIQNCNKYGLNRHNKRSCTSVPSSQTVANGSNSEGIVAEDT